MSNTEAPGVWYTDRYAPDQFISTSFDGGNRLLLGISAADYKTPVPNFYNTQGRKYDLGNPIGSFISADLYIGTDWQSNLRRADLWATTVDAANAVSGYPIIGFANYDGSLNLSTGRWRVWDEASNGWVDLGATVNYGSWNNLTIKLNSDSYEFFLNGALVYTDLNTANSVQFANMMLQGYNFGESYSSSTVIFVKNSNIN